MCNAGGCDISALGVTDNRTVAIGALRPCSCPPCSTMAAFPHANEIYTKQESGRRGPRAARRIEGRAGAFKITKKPKCLDRMIDGRIIGDIFIILPSIILPTSSPTVLRIPAQPGHAPKSEPPTSPACAVPGVPADPAPYSPQTSFSRKPDCRQSSGNASGSHARNNRPQTPPAVPGEKQNRVCRRPFASAGIRFSSRRAGIRPSQTVSTKMQYAE